MQILYGTIVNNYEKEAIEKVQWEAARIVTGTTKSCSRVKLLEDTGWDTMEKRRYKHRMITFFQNDQKHGSFLFGKSYSSQCPSG